VPVLSAATRLVGLGVADVMTVCDSYLTGWRHFVGVPARRWESVFPSGRRWLVQRL